MLVSACLVLQVGCCLTNDLLLIINFNRGFVEAFLRLYSDHLMRNILNLPKICRGSITFDVSIILRKEVLGKIHVKNQLFQ